MLELREAIFAVMQSKGINAELPLADATEEMEPVRVGSASNPGQRTPSKPGGRNTNPPTGGKGAPRSSVPPKMPSQAPKQATRPGGAARSHSGSTKPPTAPKSNTGMIAGIVLGVLVVGGGAAFFVNKSASDKREAEEKQRIASEKARKAKEAAAQPEQLTVSVVSEPQGAEVDVTWPDGAKSAATPFQLQLPKNAKVHFEFKKDGYVPYVMDSLADQTLVNAVLKAIPAPKQPEKPVAAADDKGSDEKAPKKAPKKKKDDVPAQKDGLIDLGDAFK
jgi:hypothetical protein